MTSDLLTTEIQLIRERALTANSTQALFTELEDDTEFRAIGDVLKQLSFTFHSQSNPSLRRFTMAKSRFYLECPFDEKDMCKSIGGRWDMDQRKWFVPSELDPDQFRRWWPDDASATKSHLFVVEND